MHRDIKEFVSRSICKIIQKLFTRDDIKKFLVKIIYKTNNNVK